MSGHSKWATTKHKKAVIDARRGKLFAKIIRQIEVAARDGGGNVDANPTLADAVAKAKAAEMPNDTIDRAIKRGTGELEGMKYETLTYEGYGPGGVAVLLEVMTDNRNRAAADVRRIFTRNGGSMGDPGSVSWMFTKKGLVLVPLSEAGEEEIFLLALEAGADDIVQDGDYWQIVSAPEELNRVKEALVADGITPESARISMEPENTLLLDRETAEKVLKLMEDLEDSDDVQEVYSNFEIPDELMAEISR
ncbi:MAG: YebC/PmpR family DNA-binding transcriptional regulator [Actinomycetota bacterium]|nr:YebC/PmpR family DNA-binding transcriptional regulator [Actinomycetota bacterium]